MIIEQLTDARNKLLSAVAESKANMLRAINDAETDSQSRFEKLRKELDEEYSDFNDAVFEAYGKPETMPEAKTETVSEIIT